MKNRYIFGLTLGAVWLTVASVGFGTWSLLTIGTPAAKTGLIILTLVAMSLIGAGAFVVAALRRSPDGFGSNTPEGRAMGRRFVWTVVAELIAIGIVTVWCIRARRFALIVPLDLVVVGLHFFPLAQIFRVPRYHAMALLFCVIPLVTLWTTRSDARLGGALACVVVPGLGCGVVALLTAAANLREAWRSVTPTRQPAENPI